MAEPFERAFTEAPTALALVDRDGHLRHVNDAWCRLAGYSAGKARTLTLQEVLDPDGGAVDLSRIEGVLSRALPEYRVDGRLVDAHGRAVPVQIAFSLVHDDAGRPQYLEAHIQTVAPVVRVPGDEVLERDPLTGLFTRRRFETLLQQEVRASRRYGGGAVVVLDLDRFKEVNDRFGHRAGDEVLTMAARALQRRTRDTDLLARLGGDEFGIILPRIDRIQAERVAEDLVQAVRRQVVALGGEHVAMTASVGVALFAAVDGFDPLAAADLAMYEAKLAGRDRYACYGAFTGDGARSRLAAAAHMQHAIDRELLELYCQPILHLGNGAIDRYELLVRLPMPDGTLAAPHEFLHLAERLGAVAAIDGWVVERAAGIIAAHTTRGRDLTLHVNVSARSFGDARLLAAFDRALSASLIDPDRLVFEVSEPGVIGNLDQAGAFVDAIRGRGGRVALDDFGSGLGSLYCLKHLTVDYLKVDGGLLATSDGTHADHLMVDAVVGIARAMGTPTIAEFVSSDEVLERLRAGGVNYAQGFRVGEARPVGDVL